VYKHILIPTDGSDLSEEAIEHGVALAKALSAKVTAVTVSEPFHAAAFEPGFVNAYKEYITTLAAKYLRVAKDAATASGVTCDTVQIEHEQPYQAIIDTAEKRGCDVIVMASHGRRGCSTGSPPPATAPVPATALPPAKGLEEQSNAAKQFADELVSIPVLWSDHMVSDDTPETVHAARIPAAASTEARRRRRGGGLINAQRARKGTGGLYTYAWSLFRHRCGGHVGRVGSGLRHRCPRRRPTARSKRADALDWSVRSP
jgi:nucleotide-binding universal stress UspA family protein